MSSSGIETESNRILVEFKTNIISFFDELIDQFPEEPDLVVVRIFVNDQVPIEDFIDLFVYNLNRSDQRLRNCIKERNEKYLLENRLFSIFDSKNKIVKIRKFWRSRLDDDDKIVIWKYLAMFVYLADKYLKSKM